MARLDDLTKGTLVRGVLPDHAVRAVEVRFLDRSEFPGIWDPATDARLTVWDLAQNLILALETGGEARAADLLGRASGLGETAKEALADNAPVVARPEIPGLAAGQSTPRSVQAGML